MSTDISIGVVRGFDEVSFLYYCNSPVYVTLNRRVLPYQGPCQCGERAAATTSLRKVELLCIFRYIKYRSLAY